VVLQDIERWIHSTNWRAVGVLEGGLRILEEDQPPTTSTSANKPPTKRCRKTQVRASCSAWVRVHLSIYLPTYLSIYLMCTQSAFAWIARDMAVCLLDDGDPPLASVCVSDWLEGEANELELMTPPPPHCALCVCLCVSLVVVFVVAVVAVVAAVAFLFVVMVSRWCCRRRPSRCSCRSCR
jgi:hypothetical protein